MFDKIVFDFISVVVILLGESIRQQKEKDTHTHTHANVCLQCVPINDVRLL